MNESSGQLYATHADSDKKVGEKGGNRDHLCRFLERGSSTDLFMHRRGKNLDSGRTFATVSNPAR